MVTKPRIGLSSLNATLRTPRHKVGVSGPVLGVGGFGFVLCCWVCFVFLDLFLCFLGALIRALGCLSMMANANKAGPHHLCTTSAAPAKGPKPEP